MEIMAKSEELSQKRLLAFDIGTVRIGLAAWLPGSQLAVALPYRRRNSLKEDLKYFRTLIEERSIEALVVGLPIALSGKKTDSTKNAEFWVNTLKTEFSLPVYTQDESLSSQQAESRLIQMGHSRQKRKEQIDSLAASIILEDFLREQSH